MNIGLASHNLKYQIPNETPTHGQIISNLNLKSQAYIEKINRWPKNKQKIISEKKEEKKV